MLVRVVAALPACSTSRTFLLAGMLAAEEKVDTIVEAGAVPAIVPLLSVFSVAEDEGDTETSTSARSAPDPDFSVG